MNAAFMLIICIFVLVIVGMITMLVVKNNYYKEVDELEKRKNTLSDCGVADELAKVKKLNMRGQAETQFETWREQWDEIDSLKVQALTFELMEVDELLGKFHFPKARNLLARINEEIQLAEDQIESIIRGVNDLMVNHEENSEQIKQLQRTYKELKKVLLAHRHSFTFVEEEIEKELQHAFDNMQYYEELISNGDYFEAGSVVETTGTLLEQLQTIMAEVPQLQVECQTTLPVQIDNIADGYKEMLEDGYILSHLGLEEEIESLRNQNKEMLQLIKELKVEEVKVLVEEVKLRIDSIYDSLEAEIIAKQEVVTVMKEMSESISNVKAENKASKEETVTVKLSYQLTDKEMETQKYIEKQLSVLSKRYERIANQISGNEAAYSIIQVDVNDISQQLQTLGQSQQEYMGMLHMLRADEMEAKKQLDTLKHLLQETKRILTVSNLPGVPDTYFQRYNHAREKMAIIHQQLDVKPLNMVVVNTGLQEVVELVNNVYEEAIKMVEDMQLVEQVIQYGNRYRGQNNRMASGLYKAEKLFREFEYTAALEEATAAIDTVDPGAINRLQEIIDERKTPLY